MSTRLSAIVWMYAAIAAATWAGGQHHLAGGALLAGAILAAINLAVGRARARRDHARLAERVAWMQAEWMRRHQRRHACSGWDI